MTLRSIINRVFGMGAQGIAAVSRPNHWDEEPYRLFVDEREAKVLNRFDRQVAYVYLWGEGSSDAIWLVHCCYAWGNISARLFGTVYQEQKRFMRREDAIRFIEDRLGITRDTTPPKDFKPAPGKTMWETEELTSR